MIDLRNLTIIIPIMIEHEDRYNNAKCTLNFLNHHLKTNVFLYEVSKDGQSRLDFLSTLKNLDISIINDTYKDVFHRMHYLNVLLNEVTTPVVCNYDIDVVLMPNVYHYCVDSIIKGEADVMYPYSVGNFQKKINKSFDRRVFCEDYNLSEIKDFHIIVGPSECGHCVFLNTETYRKEGGENENFVSWGPEDKERAFRFHRLGYKVCWTEDSYVYHFEHERGRDSGVLNPYLEHNEKLFIELQSKPEVELRAYYKNQPYIQQYDNFLHSK